MVGILIVVYVALVLAQEGKEIVEDTAKFTAALVKIVGGVAAGVLLIVVFPALSPSAMIGHGIAGGDTGMVAYVAMCAAAAVAAFAIAKGSSRHRAKEIERLSELERSGSISAADQWRLKRYRQTEAEAAPVPKGASGVYYRRPSGGKRIGDPEHMEKLKAAIESYEGEVPEGMLTADLDDDGKVTFKQVR